MSEQTDKLTLMYDAAAIDIRVRAMAAAINARYAGGPLLVVGVLKGAFIFCADLVRCLNMPVEVDFVRLASYGKGTSGQSGIQFLKDVETPLAGRDVLIVEDIVDTGFSMSFLYEQFADRGAASISLAALVDKPERRKTTILADFTGFYVPDAFIVGYGLDYAEKYRELPGIYILNVADLP